MKRLIGCVAAGVLLLAVGVQNAVGAGPMRSAPAMRSVPSFAGAIHTSTIGTTAPIFRHGPGPMIGTGAPIYRHGRLIGPGVYGVVPYFYDGYYANENCFVWVRRHGVLRRVYICE